MYENVRKCLELLPVSYHLYRMARRALDDNKKAQLMWFLKSGRYFLKNPRYNDISYYESYRFFLKLFYILAIGKKSYKPRNRYNRLLNIFEKEFNNVLHS